MYLIKMPFAIFVIIITANWHTIEAGQENKLNRVLSIPKVIVLHNEENIKRIEARLIEDANVTQGDDIASSSSAANNKCQFEGCDLSNACGEAEEFRRTYCYELVKLRKGDPSLEVKLDPEAKLPETVEGDDPTKCLKQLIPPVKRAAEWEEENDGVKRRLKIGITMKYEMIYCPQTLISNGQKEEKEDKERDDEDSSSDSDQDDDEMDDGKNSPERANEETKNNTDKFSGFFAAELKSGQGIVGFPTDISEPVFMLSPPDTGNTSQNDEKDETKK